MAALRLLSLLALALAWGAGAQPVPLTLSSPSGPLPDGTVVYVLSSEGVVNTPFYAPDLAAEPQGVLETRVIGGAGRTEAGVDPTAQSGRVYLAIAVLPRETTAPYVSMTRVAYQAVPGYEPVQAGNLAMAPLPADDTGARLAAVLARLQSAPSPLVGSNADADTGGGRTDPVPSSTRWWAWLLAGLAAGGLAFWSRGALRGTGRRSRIRDAEPIAPMRPSSDRSARPEAEGARSRRSRPDQLAARLAQQEEAIRALADIVNRQREEIAQHAKEIEALNRRGSASPPAGRPPSGAPTSPPPTDSPRRAPKNWALPSAEDVGAAFVSWCQAEPKGLGEPSRFETHLRAEARLSTLTVETIERALDPSTLTFPPAPTDGVAYWMVRAGFDGYLLPRPTADGFTDLHPDAFTWPAARPTPETLAACTPARLLPDGAGRTVAQPGTLH